MAIYVADSTRQRRLLGIAGACLIAGLVVGGAVGRATTSSLEDRVREVKAQAEDAVTALQRLPIEYEQMLAGDGGESQDTVQNAIDSAQDQLREAYSDAIWIGSGAPAGTDAKFVVLSEVVHLAGSAEDFSTAVDAVLAEIEDRFGIDVEPGG